MTLFQLDKYQETLGYTPRVVNKHFSDWDGVIHVSVTAQTLEQFSNNNNNNNNINNNNNNNSNTKGSTEGFLYWAMDTPLQATK